MYANVVKHNGNFTFINDTDGAINKISSIDTKIQNGILNNVDL